MKKLFLASSFADVTNIFEQFAGNLSGKSVTFIPTASIVEQVIFYVDSGKKALEKLGLIVDELEISIATEEEVARKLIKNDYIYVSGGNTFFLLQEMKKKGADKIIIDQVNAGKLYIGESAGAMVASKNVNYASAMDSVKKALELKDFDSLGLVDFYPVPHYTNFPFKKAVDKIIAQYGSELDLKPISNKEVILVTNSDVTVTDR